MTTTAETLLDGLCFPEGPRWHEDRLWFSDMNAGRVMAVDLDGRAEVIVELEGRPSGLGWLPDGRLLIVSMLDRRLLRLDSDGLHEVADLMKLARYHCNDMVVDASGRAYIGNFGFDLEHGSERVATEIIRVDPDGSAVVAADDLLFPNGTVITDDGRTLIVGETFGARLTAFDVASDGTLSNRRLWAGLDGSIPDGICLDADGGIWVASPVSAEVLRVLEGGEVTHRVRVETQAFACMLGGPEGRTLFICTAETSDPQQTISTRRGRIEIVRVDVPGAGLP